jgi:hypothetical protein
VDLVFTTASAPGLSNELLMDLLQEEVEIGWTESRYREKEEECIECI